MKDNENKNERQQVDVNGQCQLMDSQNNNKPIQGLFGIG